MTTRQTSTILAALRHWQYRNLPDARRLSIGLYEDMATHDGEFPQLDTEEVDALCELLTHPAPVANKPRVIIESEGEHLVAVHSSVPLDVALLNWHLSDTQLPDDVIDKRNALDTEASGLPFCVRF